MTEGFDIKELTNFEKKMMSLATTIMPKESKKLIKKSASKLNKVNKNAFKDSGAAAGSGTTEEEILKRFKDGKVYKYNGDLSCRAYAAHPLAHLLDLGFTHTGKGEKWIPGYHFMDKAKGSFEGTYYNDIQNFLDDMLGKSL